MDITLFNFINEIQYSPYFTNKEFRNRMLEKSKKYRKEHGDERAIQDGWFFFDKKKPSIDEQLIKLTKLGLIKEEYYNKSTNIFRLSKRGKQFLFESLISDKIIDFRMYQKSINQKAYELGYPPIQELLIASWYHNGKKDLFDIWEKADKKSSINEGYLLDCIRFLGYTEEDINEKYFLVFEPRLFLTNDIKHAKVTLKIESELFDTIECKTYKPYPNDRYVVGYVNKEGIKSRIFAPLAFKKNEINNMKIKFKWTLENEFQIIHTIKVTFDYNTTKSRFFIFEQGMKDVYDIPSFGIATEPFSKDTLKNREVDVYVNKGKDEVLFIDEKVTLIGQKYDNYQYFSSTLNQAIKKQLANK